MRAHIFLKQIERSQFFEFRSFPHIFGIKRYVTRSRVTKPAKVMVIDAIRFLDIIRENRSEFVIMSYLAKVYFQRYINAMKEFEICMALDGFV